MSYFWTGFELVVGAAFGVGVILFVTASIIAILLEVIERL